MSTEGPVNPCFDSNGDPTTCSKYVEEENTIYIEGDNEIWLPILIVSLSFIAIIVLLVVILFRLRKNNQKLSSEKQVPRTDGTIIEMAPPPKKGESESKPLTEVNRHSE